MRKKNLSTGLSWLWLSILIVAIDRYSKFWVIHHLNFFEPYAILPVFNFTLAYNTGAAFSFLHSAAGWQNWAFSTFAIFVAITILIWLSRLPARERWMNIALCCILAGAVGNAWDRILYGYVIDFLDFHLNDWHFAIFNIADSAICVGTFMLFLGWIKINKTNKKKIK